MATRALSWVLRSSPREPTKIKQEPGIKQEPAELTSPASQAGAAAAPTKKKKARRSKNDGGGAAKKPRRSKNDVKAEPMAVNCPSVPVKVEGGASGTTPAWAVFEEPAAKSDEVDEEPYPKFSGPSPDECAAAVSAMAELYGLPSEQRPVRATRPWDLHSVCANFHSELSARRCQRSGRTCSTRWSGRS